MHTESTSSMRKIHCRVLIFLGRFNAAVAMSGTAILSFEVAEQTTLGCDERVCARLDVELFGQAALEFAGSEDCRGVSYRSGPVRLDSFRSFVAVCIGGSFLWRIDGSYWAE